VDFNFNNIVWGNSAGDDHSGSGKGGR
jgi:hypothetical protein